MKIGILTHYKANNFGANLQALSTAEFLKKQGHEPIFINWTPYLALSNSRTSDKQIKTHQVFAKKHFESTGICNTEKDINDELDRIGIKHIIVGSDAVLTVSSKLQNVSISKKGIKYIKPMQDYDFPNPFWLSFKIDGFDYKAALLSPSCQNSAYFLFSLKKKRMMKQQLDHFSYCSARDKWTKKMIESINNNFKNIPITPDPVFGFNKNVNITISKEEILKKYNLPEKYLLVSFYPSALPSEEWLKELKAMAEREGLECVSLPLPQGENKTCFDYSIKLPLDAIDWFFLIKYSCGYVGNNMHPIIVSIHNSVPFFSIDNHGLKFLRIFKIKKSSKTYDLLNEAGLIDNWQSLSDGYSKISPTEILYKIKNFDKSTCQKFADLQLEKYNTMMESILSLFKSEKRTI